MPFQSSSEFKMEKWWEIAIEPLIFQSSSEFKVSYKN